MQDLTFGEQVKIVLSRKDMTIKDLAKKIEARTKKKMSRQNLTQRLGRDNFQEQDMRMIAEILGCPFQLNILEDRVAEEKTEVIAEKKSEVIVEEKSEAIAEKKLEVTAREKSEVIAGEKTEVIIEESTRTDKDAESRKTVAKMVGTGVSDKEESIEELTGTADKSDKEAKEPGEDETKPEAVAPNERDITIGEFVALNEELDAMLESANSELPVYQESEAEVTTALQVSYENEHAKSVASDSEEDVQGESLDGLHEEYTAGYMEGYTGDYHEEGEDLAGAGEEPVESLLEEIETLEREEKKQEKPEKPEEKHRGWRAYLLERIKRRSKSQASQNSDHTEENNSAESRGTYTYQKSETHTEGGYQGGDSDGRTGENSYGKSAYDAEESSITGYAEEFSAEGYSREEYGRESDLSEGYNREEYGSEGYLSDGYAKEAHGGESSSAENYRRVEYSRGNYLSEGYSGAEDSQGGYTADGYAEAGYGQESYPAEAYPGAEYTGNGYMENEYTAAGYYQEEQIPEEEEPGDLNPYTGKEYESNSVRMHPSRIGYVQVYDRAIHKWTDMTEWAFLGYQERKKQLLGKDYDPPIYLD